jgi:hypothetical protein
MLSCREDCSCGSRRHSRERPLAARLGVRHHEDDSLAVGRRRRDPCMPWLAVRRPRRQRGRLRPLFEVSNVAHHNCHRPACHRPAGWRRVLLVAALTRWQRFRLVRGRRLQHARRTECAGHQHGVATIAGASGDVRGVSAPRWPSAFTDGRERSPAPGGEAQGERMARMRFALRDAADGSMHAASWIMDERAPIPRTVHVVLPHSGRSLCGYEEERPGPEGAAATPCPECAALLRSGMVVRRSRIRVDGRACKRVPATH